MQDITIISGRGNKTVTSDLAGTINIKYIQMFEFSLGIISVQWGFEYKFLKLFFF